MSILPPLPSVGDFFVNQDGTTSTIVEDTSTSDVTEEEIVEFAAWIGIDLAVEPELLWIAREGLKAPLSAEWKPCRTGDGDTYYFNFETGESTWDHPMDIISKKKVISERARRSGQQSTQAQNEAARSGEEEKPSEDD